MSFSTTDTLQHGSGINLQFLTRKLAVPSVGRVSGSKCLCRLSPAPFGCPGAFPAPPLQLPEICANTSHRYSLSVLAQSSEGLRFASFWKPPAPSWEGLPAALHCSSLLCSLPASLRATGKGQDVARIMLNSSVSRAASRLNCIWKILPCKSRSYGSWDSFNYLSNHSTIYSILVFFLTVAKAIKT